VARKQLATERSCYGGRQGQMDLGPSGWTFTEQGVNAGPKRSCKGQPFTSGPRRPMLISAGQFGAIPLAAPSLWLPYFEMNGRRETGGH